MSNPSRLFSFSLALFLLSPLTHAGPVTREIATEAKRSNVLQTRDDSEFTPVILISYSTPITSPVNGESFTAGGAGTISWSVRFLLVIRKEPKYFFVPLFSSRLCSASSFALLHWRSYDLASCRFCC